MTAIRVSLGERSYDICVDTTYRTLPARLKRLGLGPSLWVVSHPWILRRYGLELLRPLKRAGYHVSTIAVPESERSKSSAVIERVIETLAKQAARQVPTLLAFGGGVVGDLTGFVAAIFRRGVPYVQLPTTLLAQVDSAIGGKVGIDLPFAKNLVGAFNQPRLVMDHLGLLASLPPRQRRSGLSEIIKYGVMADAPLFRFLEERLDQCLAGELRATRLMVDRCSRIKARVVSQDERETRDIRIRLNFGHTLGHALESITGYRRFTHGEAIAIGMVCASSISVDLGLWPAREHARLVQLFGRAGLPVRTSGVPLAKIKRAIIYDKKFRDGKLHWVLPRAMGRVAVHPNVPPAVVWRAVRSVVSD